MSFRKVTYASRTCIQIREIEEVCLLGNLYEFIRVYVEWAITTVNQLLNALTILTHSREQDYCINALINTIIASSLDRKISDTIRNTCGAKKNASGSCQLFLGLLLGNNRYINAEAIRERPEQRIATQRTGTPEVTYVHRHIVKQEPPVLTQTDTQLHV